MLRYEVIANRSYRNNKNGKTASLYGAHPAVSAGDVQNWAVVQNGFTIMDNVTGRIGGFQSCPPGSSKEHADAVAAALNETVRQGYLKAGMICPFHA
jgi:hypothetical protein